MNQTAKLGLPYIMASQAQKHITHNESLKTLDVAVQLSVADSIRNSPPVAPVEGDFHIIASVATGAWSGKDGQIAAWQEGSWTFCQPSEGWTAWDQATAELLVYRQEAWVAHSTLLHKVGIGAVPDAINRLAVKSDASLFDNTYDSHRLKINKAAAAATASILLQTNYSGRVEMGLSGDESFHLKTSDDGSTWREAMVVNSDGTVELPENAETTKAHIAGRTIITSGIFDVNDGTPAAVVLGYDQANDYGFIGAVETGIAQKTLSIQPLGGPISFGAPTASNKASAGGSGGFQHSSAANDARLDLTATSGSGFAAIFARNAALTAGQVLSLNRYGGGVAVSKTSVTSGFALDVNGDVRCTSLIQTSDRKMKTVLGPSLGLAFIECLSPITFRWKPTAKHHDAVPSDTAEMSVPVETPKRLHQGLIAQDVAAVASALGVDFGGYKDTAVKQPDKQPEYLLDYSEFIAPLVSAVQELSKRVAELEFRKSSPGRICRAAARD